MKRFLATGVAAAVALTTFAALPSAANAGGWRGGPYYSGYYYPPPPPPRYYYYPQPYYHYDPGPAIVAGVLGALLGAVINQRPHKVYRKKRY